MLGSAGSYMVPVFKMRTAAPAVGRMPALARTAAVRFPAARMADAAAETTDEALCIEDEAVEECTIASWDAGKITVPAPPAPGRPPRDFISSISSLLPRAHDCNQAPRITRAHALPRRSCRKRSWTA